MRRMFKEMARLTINLERADFDRMTVAAREEGKLVVDWAREALLGDLEAMREFEETRSKVSGESKAREATVAHNLATRTVVYDEVVTKQVEESVERLLEPNAEPVPGAEREYVPLGVRGQKKEVVRKKAKKNSGDVDTAPCQHNFFRGACPICNA